MLLSSGGMICMRKEEERELLKSQRILAWDADIKLQLFSLSSVSRMRVTLDDTGQFSLPSLLKWPCQNGQIRHGDQRRNFGKMVQRARELRAS